MKKYIYLAGPIAGHTSAEADDWREEFSSRLPENIIGVSPLRSKPDDEQEVYQSWTQDPKFGTPMAISGKNWYDTNNCDAILAYLPKAMNEQRPSYGTILEIGWAIGLRKPVFLVTDDELLSNHPLIKANVNWVFDNFEDALIAIDGILGIYI